MKIAVLTNAYNEERWISGCVKQFTPFGLDHIVLISACPWNGLSYDRDLTENIVSSLGAKPIVGFWATETEQLNWGLNLLKEYDWVIICDSDERYTELQIRLLLDELNFMDAPVVKTDTWSVYWKSPEYRLSPNQTDYPVIAVKPYIKFVNLRNPELRYDFAGGVHLHHFSYVRTNEDMLKKIKTFSHANEFDLNSWYENKWLKWNSYTEDLHPVQPSQFKKAYYDPCPVEFKVKGLLP